MSSPQRLISHVWLDDNAAALTFLFVIFSNKHYIYESATPFYMHTLHTAVAVVAELLGHCTRKKYWMQFYCVWYCVNTNYAFATTTGSFF